MTRKDWKVKLRYHFSEEADITAFHIEASVPAAVVFASPATTIDESAHTVWVNVADWGGQTNLQITPSIKISDKASCNLSGDLLFVKKTSESKTIKTPVAPVYSIDGTYTAIQYDAQGKEEPESYKVQINYVAGSETSVEIFNIFNGGQKITGTYNKADGTLVIPTDQIVMLHPSYGEVLMKGVDDAIENYTKTISCSFTAKGGTLITGNWQASCSAGSFGFFYLSMKHE